MARIGKTPAATPGKHVGFIGLFNALTRLQLSASQIACLQAWLASLSCPGRCFALIEGAFGTPVCPHCAGRHCHRHGEANGLQRYRCLGCRRSFNALTGTPLARLRHRDRWLPYLQCLLTSTTVRDAADSVGVAKSTSFRWRHRFIAAIRRERRPALQGIVEADETYLLESQKGSRHLDRPARRRGGRASRPGVNREHDCILVARDRSRCTYEFVAGRGPISARRLAACLEPVIERDVLLVSDGALAYQAFARSVPLRHETINVRAGIHVRDAIHLLGVNNWHRNFKTWLLRFHGVASRYLANYTGWRRVLDTPSLKSAESWLKVSVAARKTHVTRKLDNSSVPLRNT